MKRNLILLLALALILTLVGCQPAAETETESPAAAVVTEESTETTEEPEESESTAEEMAEFQTTASVEETVLYEDENTKITATGLEYGNYSVELGLLIENNGAEDLNFLSGTLGYSCNSVNGYMIESGYLNCDVSAGKKSNESIDFSYDELMLYGITEIAEMEIGIEIKADDQDPIYTGPMLLQSSAAADYGYDFAAAISSAACQQEYGFSVIQSSGESVAVADGISVLSALLMQNKDGDESLMVEVENTTSDTVVLASENIAVNGLTACDSCWDYRTVNPGKHAVLDICLNDLQDNNIYEAFGISEFGSISAEIARVDEDYNKTGEIASVTLTVDGRESSFDAKEKELYNANGLRLSYVAVLEDESDYSDDIHILLLAENSGDIPLSLTDVYDSFSVNGFMANCLMYSSDIPAGSSDILDIQISSIYFEDIGISAPEDIEEAEIGMKIMTEDWETLDEFSVVMKP